MPSALPLGSALDHSLVGDHANPARAGARDSRAEASGDVLAEDLLGSLLILFGVQARRALFSLQSRNGVKCFPFLVEMSGGDEVDLRKHYLAQRLCFLAPHREGAKRRFR